MVEEESTMKRLLDLSQDSKRKGASARLFLETRNGEVFVNFSSQLPVGVPSGFEEVKKRKWKSPSSRRRDMARLEAWKVRKNLSETVENLSAEANNEKESNDDEASDNLIMDENQRKVNSDRGVEKSDQSDSIGEDEDGEEDEECRLPKTVSLLKVFVDGLRNLEGAEMEIKQMLSSKNVVLKNMKVLKELEISGVFKKIFAIEIEDLKRSDLLLLEDEFRVKRNTDRIYKMETSLCSGYEWMM